jgi:hypothetical protein
MFTLPRLQAEGSQCKDILPFSALPSAHLLRGVVVNSKKLGQSDTKLAVPEDYIVIIDNICANIK